MNLDNYVLYLLDFIKMKKAFFDENIRLQHLNALNEIFETKRYDNKELDNIAEEMQKNLKRKM